MPTRSRSTAREPTGYGLGQGGLGDGADARAGRLPGVLRDWVEESYRIVAPKRLTADARTDS